MAVCLEHFCFHGWCCCRQLTTSTTWLILISSLRPSAIFPTTGTAYSDRCYTRMHALIIDPINWSSVAHALAPTKPTSIALLQALNRIHGPLSMQSRQRKDRSRWRLRMRPGSHLVRDSCFQTLFLSSRLLFPLFLSSSFISRRLCRRKLVFVIVFHLSGRACVALVALWFAAYYTINTFCSPYLTAQLPPPSSSSSSPSSLSSVTTSSSTTTTA